MDVSKWKEKLEERRERKDEFFSESPKSPISDEDRDVFDGLDYYPPDPDYRFEVELQEHDDKEKLSMEISGGGEQDYFRWGEFCFEIDGEEHKVQAYKSGPDDETLFVPFRDSTCGEETYGAGRYLDLDEEDKLENGKWILDFNKAYNPWCAYSDDYSCPMTPPENWLEIPIRAGEKIYSCKV